jgi:hypothetical protein
MNSSAFADRIDYSAKTSDDFSAQNKMRIDFNTYSKLKISK